MNVRIYMQCTCDPTITSAHMYTGLHPAAALQAAPPVLAQALRHLAAPAAHRECIYQMSLYIYIYILRYVLEEIG